MTDANADKDAILGWVTVHAQECNGFVYDERSGSNANRVTIPANSTDSIQFPELVEARVATYRYDPGSPAVRAVYREALYYDEESRNVCIEPVAGIAGKRFRVRILGLRADSDGAVPVTLQLGNLRPIEGWVLDLAGDDLAHTVAAEFAEADTEWHEFPPAPGAWSLLVAHATHPNWGGVIEWQVWEEIPPADRKVMVRASKDGGHNWGPWRASTLGALGQYQHRVRFRRFGRGSQFCFQVRVTSPLVMDHLGGVADMEAGE